MTLKELSDSKSLRQVILALGIIIFVFLIFAMGVAVGYHKASFSYRWGEDYHRNFGGPHGGFFGEPPLGGRDDFANPHGTFGTIASISLPTFIVQGEHDVEKTVLVTNETAIRRFMEQATSSDLTIGERVVIIGEPNAEGQIVAKLIRVMPADVPMPTPGTTPLPIQ